MKGINAWKLTNENGRTFGGCQWGPGVTHRTDGVGPLCSAGWLHFYRDPLIGLFLNPLHADYDPERMRLWECRYEGRRGDDLCLKSGAMVLTTVREIECPRLHVNHRVAFAIYCAEPFGDKAWMRWAKAWMSGADRSREAVGAAHVARAAANAAAHAAAYAADAAYAAAAYAAAYAAARAAAYAAAAAARAAGEESLRRLSRAARLAVYGAAGETE